MIGGLDVGTTGCKLVVYDEIGALQAYAYEEYQVSRAAGEHEIHAEIIWRTVCRVIR